MVLIKTLLKTSRSISIHIFTSHIKQNILLLYSLPSIITVAIIAMKLTFTLISLCVLALAGFGSTRPAEDPSPSNPPSIAEIAKWKAENTCPYTCKEKRKYDRHCTCERGNPFSIILCPCLPSCAECKKQKNPMLPSEEAPDAPDGDI